MEGHHCDARHFSRMLPRLRRRICPICLKRKREICAILQGLILPLIVTQQTEACTMRPSCEAVKPEVYGPGAGLRRSALGMDLFSPRRGMGRGVTISHKHLSREPILDYKANYRPLKMFLRPQSGSGPRCTCFTTTRRRKPAANCI